MTDRTDDTRQSPETQTRPGPSHMGPRRIFGISVLVSGLLWTAALGWWFALDTGVPLKKRAPGMDGAPADVAAAPGTQSTTRIGEFFALHDGVAADIPGSWPRFRGGSYSNIVTGGPRLRSSFADSLPVLWQVSLGEGHAAPVVSNGRVFVLDYDEGSDADALRCLSLADGAEIWRRWYHVKVKRNHGMSRTIPAVTDSFVVTIGPRCHVMCVRPSSGDLLWGIDLVARYGTEEPLWYTGQCPLIDDTVAVLAPGGTALMVGVDCRSGEVLWEAPNPGGWKMSHSSVMPMDFAGRRMYLYCAVGGIAGVAAEGEDRGRVLFASSAFNQSVVAPSPVVLDGGRIFMTAGYGAGSALLQLTSQTDTIGVELVRRISVKEGASSEQQTPLYYRGHLFMVLPKDAGELRGQFVCVKADAPDEILWSSGPDRRFGLGPYLIADGTFFILDDDGTLTVARATTERYEELGQVRLMDGVDAWGPMAPVGGRLLLRDASRLLCVDVRR